MSVSCSEEADDLETMIQRGWKEVLLETRYSSFSLFWERQREKKGRKWLEARGRRRFTSVFSTTAESPRASAVCDEAIGWARKTEADFRRWGKRLAAVGVVGPIGNSRRNPRERSARVQVPGPNRPHTPHLPYHPRTYHCHRDILFWRPVFHDFDDPKTLQRFPYH